MKIYEIAAAKNYFLVADEVALIRLFVIQFYNGPARVHAVWDYNNENRPI